ncbi:hypothetical protein HDU67_001847 [Dinochytrium kinnereticum]|nr:hypothetical protein HDU67_001847 [Dinochytrium kinnereticum]
MLPPPPPQVISPITGFPTWRTPVEGITLEKIETGLIYSTLGMIMGLFLVNRYNVFTRQSKGQLVATGDTVENSTTRVSLVGLSTLMRNYILASIASGIIVMPFDLGKIFSTIGAIHNSAEVAICIILANQNG